MVWVLRSSFIPLNDIMMEGVLCRIQPLTLTHDYAVTRTHLVSLIRLPLNRVDHCSTRNFEHLEVGVSIDAPCFEVNLILCVHTNEVDIQPTTPISSLGVVYQASPSSASLKRFPNCMRMQFLVKVFLSNVDPSTSRGSCRKAIRTSSS
jgi:hypothetical protein